MRKTQPKFKTLEDLQNHWYKKLEKDGFQDIEQKDGNLKSWASAPFKSHYNEILFKAKEDYFRLAGQFLHDHQFVNEFERIIWELHSGGVSVRETVRILKKRRFKVYKWAVQIVLKRLTREMVTRCK